MPVVAAPSLYRTCLPAYCSSTTHGVDSMAHFFTRLLCWIYRKPDSTRRTTSISTAADSAACKNLELHVQWAHLPLIFTVCGPRHDSAGCDRLALLGPQLRKFLWQCTCGLKLTLTDTARGHAVDVTAGLAWVRRPVRSSTSAAAAVAPSPSAANLASFALLFGLSNSFR